MELLILLVILAVLLPTPWYARRHYVHFHGPLFFRPHAYRFHPYRGPRYMHMGPHHGYHGGPRF